MLLQKIYQKIVLQSVALLKSLNIFKFLNVEKVLNIFILDLH